MAFIAAIIFGLDYCNSIFKRSSFTIGDCHWWLWI